MNETVVFLGCVTPELSPRQHALYLAIKELDGYRCVRMEYVNAADQDKESDSFCDELAREPDSNIFILIVGEQYGTVHSADGKSYAEREYDAAVNAGIRRVALFVPEFERPHAVPAGLDRQRAFRERVDNDQQTTPLAFDRFLAAEGDEELRNVLKHVAVKAAVTGLKAIKATLDYLREMKTWQDEALFPDLRGKVWLLFPFIYNTLGWDSGISVANVSLDPIGLTKPQMGRVRLHFYGDGAPEPQYSCAVPPGTVFATLASTIAPGFTGYLIAECDFYPARGIAMISRLGGNDPAMYVAEIFHTEPPKKAFRRDVLNRTPGQLPAQEGIGIEDTGATIISS